MGEASGPGARGKGEVSDHTNAAHSRLDETQSKLKALYAKQGRAAQFKTQADRDTFLKAEIESLKTFEAQHARQLEDVQRDVDEAEKRAIDAGNHVGELEAADVERRDRLASLAEEIAQVRANVERMQEERK
jgi:structural maintenance of chromosome 3 (chondroitin sulfate proteoglycan 6)